MSRPHHWMEMSTHFTLLERDEGDQYGVATGEIACDLCHAVGLHIEHIDHEPWCRNAEANEMRPPGADARRLDRPTTARAVGPRTHGSRPASTSRGPGR